MCLSALSDLLLLERAGLLPEMPRWETTTVARLLEVSVEYLADVWICTVLPPRKSLTGRQELAYLLRS